MNRDTFQAKKRRSTPSRWSLGAILGMLSLLLYAGTLLAQGLQPLQPGQLSLLHWLAFLGMFFLIWTLLYWLLYPYFLRHFNPDFSKVLFWSILLFYFLTWLHLSLYLIFDLGFFFPWVRWTAAILTGLWLIWFTVVLLRSRNEAA